MPVPLVSVVVMMMVVSAVPVGDGLGGGEDEPETDPAQNPALKIARRVLPVADEAPEDRFVVRSPSGKIQVTALFLVLLVVETTDLMFALDSIPAVLGISRDPFVLYSSNITAVLGLRSLFFVLSSLLARLRYLKPALAVVDRGTGERDEAVEQLGIARVEDTGQFDGGPQNGLGATLDRVRPVV